MRTVTKQTANVAIDTIFCLEISAFGNLAVPLSKSAFSSTSYTFSSNYLWFVYYVAICYLHTILAD